MKVNFKKLDENAVLPRYAKEGDAGLDCYFVGEPIQSGGSASPALSLSFTVAAAHMS